ncbi:MAG: diaminopimelate epimerase [Candidatus Dormibacteria bacterium]
MSLEFHKIHGAANDFVVVDGRAVREDWPRLAARACDRRRAVGGDGLLVLQAPTEPGADFRMLYINADGSPAEMCGNGIRCIAKYALDIGATGARALSWETGAGPVRTEVLEINERTATVRVNMGAPRFRPADVPVEAVGDMVQEQEFVVDGSPLRLTCVSMGNPHAVAYVGSVAQFPLEHLGPLVERHPAFPRRTNFEIVEVLAPDHLRMRVWERGVGETMACGTGACAVAVASRLVRGTDEAVRVDLPGGTLRIEWREGSDVMMTGPAETAFIGKLTV